MAKYRMRYLGPASVLCLAGGQKLLRHTRKSPQEPIEVEMSAKEMQSLRRFLDRSLRGIHRLETEEVKERHQWRGHQPEGEAVSATPEVAEGQEVAASEEAKEV